MENLRCAQCESQADLRRCTACLAEWYCSRDCQRRHWKRHKVKCRKGESGAAQEGRAGEADGRAESSKAEEQPRQGKTTPDDKNDYVTVNADFEIMTCGNCCKRAPNMKRCGRCQKVTYCSRDCQKQAWKSHKDACLEVVTTEGYRRMEQHEQAERRRHRPDFLSDLLGSMRMGSTLTWEEAMSRAKRLYPQKRVVERFADLGNDMYYQPDSRSVVSISRMTGVYPHFFRHGRCLEDAEGNSSFVLFYNREDPEPYFRYDQLRDGNYFCFEHAHLHFFADGTVGFRVDDPMHVHIMES